MEQKKNYLPWLLSIVLFAITLLVFISTSSKYLMFDDAAEFALVIQLGSIAHPPGFPSYILSGMIWDRLTSFLIQDGIIRLTLFSSVLISTASILLFYSFRKIVSTLLPDGKGSMKNELCAFFPALAFAFGNTTWMWANTIEAYPFQVFSFGLVLFGLTSYQENRSVTAVVIAAIGLALGWSNHHLTMIAFTPFVPFFFTNHLFAVHNGQNDKNKKKSRAQKESWIGSYIAAIRQKDFLLFTAISAGMTIFFYGWLMYRAQQDYAFMFGRPGRLDELWFHIRGGSYTKNITETKGAIISARLPYFLELTARQFLVFFPLVIIGLIEMFKRGAKTLAMSVFLFWLIMFIYQLNNNQWASTDAYLLLPFMALCIPVVYALVRFLDTWKLQFILPLALIGTIFLGFEKHNRKTYPVSASLMKLLDESAPKNSVIIISDWTTIIQYYYYRITENFRPDLQVLHYDFKFTHYRMLPHSHPEFYKTIQPEYDKFVEELRKEHPYQVVGTGCDITTIPLQNAFQSLVLKTEKVCKDSGRPFLTDPRTHYLYSKSKFYNPSRYVSGCFSSNVPVDSSYSKHFLEMDFDFLRSPLLYDDPSCLDKIVDFQAMIDQHIFFYDANNNTAESVKANASRDKILKLQKELKKTMSFAYKI